MKAGSFTPAMMVGENETQLDREQRRQLAGKLTKFILENELSTRQKQILMLYYKEKRTMPEIAASLHVPVSSVSHTHKRAVQKIQEKMTELFSETR